jgi:Outer membrane protein and related peptidoglycan-associated (lipo)proteins
MKRLMRFALIFSCSFFTVSFVQSQGILKKLKDKTQDKVNQRIDDKTDRSIDKTLDKAESAGKANKSGKISNNTSPSTVDTNGQQTIRAYAKYDFIPGDKIIFQDDFKDEKEGEFPSQMEAKTGQGQIFSLGDENVYHTVSDVTTISPRIKGLNYLPDQYTIEFDANMEGFGGDNIEVAFAGVDVSITFYATSAEWGNFNGEVPKDVAEGWYPTNKEDHWRHIAIAVNKSLMKAYIDQFRVLNVPGFSGKATSVSITHACHNGSEYACPHMFLKNIRIASGGIDIYKKVQQDGKIITHGILFDVDKSSIKPESMGTLNSIYDLLKNDGSLKFEIDGHTDNSGTADHNLSLSKDRAEAVKAQLIKMGIDASRLTTKGFGDTKPLQENNTPEGKANNRRVEFVKV